MRELLLPTYMYIQIQCVSVQIVLGTYRNVYGFFFTE